MGYNYSPVTATGHLCGIIGFPHRLLFFFVVAVLYLPFYPAFWARQSSVLVVRLQQLANRPKRPTNRPTTLAAMTQRLTACRRCLEA